jgi:hypothetical protein
MLKGWEPSLWVAQLGRTHDGGLSQHRWERGNTTIHSHTCTC